MAIVSKIKARGGYYRSRCGASDEQIASAEQINDDRFPAGFFVLENTGRDGLLVIANSVGQVYGYCEGSLTF